MNPRNELYRMQDMKEHPPFTADAIQRMGKQPNLIRRPLLIRDSRMVLGLHEEAHKRLLK